MSKHVLRFQSLNISGKIRTEVRLVVDNNRVPEWSSDYNGDIYTSFQFFPMVTISLIRQSEETDDTGNPIKPIWNPNDSLGMSRAGVSTFVSELERIYQDLKIPDMYSYKGKRLEINEDLAAKIRRPFVIGNTTVELSAVVIIQPPDDKRIEGIKMKFNNEQSSVLLTLNDIEALILNLRTLNIDTIAFLMYLNHIFRPNKPRSFNETNLKSAVDILPKGEIE